MSIQTPTAQPAHRPRLARRIHWWRIVAFAGGILLAFSFILALATPDITSCTERACQCSRAGSQGQEVPCNTCTTTDTILTFGFVDVARVCIAREYVTCPATPDQCVDAYSDQYCAPVKRETRPTGECSLAFVP